MYSNFRCIILFIAFLIFSAHSNASEVIKTFETKKSKIEISNSNDGYILRVWDLDSHLKKPRLELTEGNRRSEGSGGNYKYVFPVTEGAYEVFILIMGSSNSPLGQFYLRGLDCEYGCENMKNYEEIIKVH